MKTKIYYYLGELFNILMVMVLLYSLAGAFCYLYELNFGPFLAIGLLMVVLFSYFIRRLKFPYAGIIVVILQVVLMFGMFFIPIPVNFGYFVFIFMISFVFLVLNARFYMSQVYSHFAELHIVFIAVPVIGYLAMDIKNSSKYMIFFFAMSILFVMFYYARSFFSNAFILASQRGQYDRMPYAEMIKNDSKLAIPFVAISALLMSLVNFDFLDDVFLKAYDSVISVIRFIFRYIFLFLEWLITFLITDVDEESKIQQTVQNVEEEVAESQFFNVLAIIIFIFIAIVLLIMFIKIIMETIKAMKGVKGSVKESLVDTDMVEIKERLKGRKSRRSQEANLSELRKRYKRTIEKKSKEGYSVLYSHTPRERAKDLMDKKNFDINELSEQYQAERYGRG